MQGPLTQRFSIQLKQLYLSVLFCTWKESKKLLPHLNHMHNDQKHKKMTYEMMKLFQISEVFKEK